MRRQFWDERHSLHVEESEDGHVWTTVAVHHLGIAPEEREHVRAEPSAGKTGSKQASRG